jgi:hypothetical protein
MFGTPIDHEESVRVRMAQRDGVQPAPGNTAQPGDNETEPVLPKVDTPMLVTPEGKLVDPAEHDLFAADREAIAREETRVMNLRDVTVAGLNTEGGGKEEEEPAPEPLKAPRIPIPEGEYVSDTDRAVVEGLNGLAEYVEKQTQAQTETVDKVIEGLNLVGKTTNEFVLEQQLTDVEARYGVDRQDLFAASRVTEIRDPETLAQIVIGQQAQTTREEEARAAAEAERKSDAGGIGGQSRGGSSDGGDPAKREEVDYSNNAELARVFKITQPQQNW